MRLEKELNITTPFEDERLRAIVNLTHTYNVLLGITQEDLKEFNLNDQHYNILNILQDHDPEPLSIGTIKHMLLNKRGDITRLLDKLDAMGLLVRRMNPENRRSIDVKLSTAGREQLDVIKVKLSRRGNFKENLSEEEAQQLNDLLDKLRG